ADLTPDQRAAEPPLEPPTPLTSASAVPLAPDSPELAFSTVVHRIAAQEPEPKVTSEMVRMQIEAEAEQKQAEQQQLAREVVESKFREFVERLQKTHADRQPFHDDLRRALRELGAEAGPEIKAICERFGRDTHGVVEKKVRLDMTRWSARLTRAAKID